MAERKKFIDSFIEDVRSARSVWLTGIGAIALALTQRLEVGGPIVVAGLVLMAYDGFIKKEKQA